MSYAYRDRVNRDKPKLSDRFRGKSGEEIVEELRKDFAKRKQMFFDTAPHTTDFMKPGFPFDDSCSRWRNRGDSDLRHRLDEIAQRYPQFATQLRDWTTEEDPPSGMGWGSKPAQSQPSTPQQTASQTQTEAANTAQQPQQPTPATQTGPEGDGRTQRAMSAPPDNRAKDQPQRFVSRLEINPNSAPGDTSQQQPPQHPSQPANQQQQAPPPQQSAQPEPQKKTSNVRHIPIFVEDRNETVMPRADVDSSTADFGKSFGSPPRERDSRDREDGFHGPAYAKYAPPTFGFMNKPKWRYQNTSPFMSRDPMHGSPPQQQHFPQQQQHHPHYQQPHHSQQQQHPQTHPHPHSQQQQHPQTHPHSQQPHPQPQQQHQQPQPQPQPEPPRQQTPPRQPPQPKDPLQEVAAVQKDVDELMKQVEAFTGTRQDKQYIYLDEMLTRNLLKLDLVETEGKENVRAARKETIKCIQKCISILESKTMTPEEIAARDKAMEVDPESTEVQSMEVSSGGDGVQETQIPGPTDSSVSSATTAPEVPNEPSSTPAPNPAEAPAPMDTTPAPEVEATSTESKDSNPPSAVNPEKPAQPVPPQPAPSQPAPAQPSPAPETTTASPPVDNPPAEPKAQAEAAVAPAAAS